MLLQHTLIPNRIYLLSGIQSLLDSPVPLLPKIRFNFSRSPLRSSSEHRSFLSPRVLAPLRVSVLLIHSRAIHDSDAGASQSRSSNPRTFVPAAYPVSHTIAPITAVQTDNISHLILPIAGLTLDHLSCLMYLSSSETSWFFVRHRLTTTYQKISPFSTPPVISTPPKH
jgi:hypothetical protein